MSEYLFRSYLKCSFSVSNYAKKYPKLATLPYMLNQWINQDKIPFSGYIESKCNPVRQFEGLRYSALSDDVVVADDDGAGFHDQHQNDAESAGVAPL